MDHDKNKTCSVALFCIALFAYGLIFSEFGVWNTMSRIGLSVSLVDRGSLYIDDFAPLTGDKATLGHHYSSSKAPGLSFLALPAVAIGVKALRLLDPNTHWVTPSDQAGKLRPTSSLYWVQRLATVTTSSLYTALAVVALFRIALLLNVNIQGALFGAIVYGFATPTWGWATTFYSHATCGAFLVFGLWAVILGTTPGQQSSKTKTVGFGLTAGLLLGAAVVIEYPAAVAAVFIALYGVWRLLHFTPEHMLIAIGCAIIGAMIAGIPLMLYNNALFGSPLSISYSYSDVHEMQEGFWGIHRPDLFTAAKLLFGGERGLLWLTPILVFTPMGWWSMEIAGQRALSLVCLAIFIFFWILITSGFVEWKEGWSTGPRYLTPALPFLALPLAWLWEQSGVLLRRILSGLAMLSSIICFAMAGIEVTAPDNNNANVVMEILLPKLVRGDIPNIGVSQVRQTLQIILYVLIICSGISILWKNTSVKHQRDRA